MNVAYRVRRTLRRVVRRLSPLALAGVLSSPVIALAQAPAAEAPKAEAAPAAAPAEAPKAEAAPAAAPAEAPKAEAAPAAEAKHEGVEAPKHEGAEKRLERHAEAAAEEAEEQGEEPHGIVNWFSWDYGPKAQDPTHRHWPPPFGFAIINFIVFLGIISRLLFKPIGRMAAERHERIKTDLETAARLRTEAEAKLKDYEKRVANVESEIEQLVAQIRTEAEAEKARIIAAAEAEAKRLRADADKQIEAEMTRVRGELRQALVAEVVAAAERLVTKNISDADQKRMADRYVTDLEKAPATQGAQS